MTYIKSPLHRGESKRSRKKKSAPMSNAFDDSSSSSKGVKSGDLNTTSAEREDISPAPATRITVEKTKLPISWVPKGAILRLNIFAELAFFIVMWAAYGFVMAYLPIRIQQAVAIAFSPWAVALSLLITGWLSARFLASLSLRFGDLQRMAWAIQPPAKPSAKPSAKHSKPSTQASAVHSSDVDIQTAVLDILFGAKESIAVRLNCLTTLYFAISTYQLVSLLY